MKKVLLKLSVLGFLSFTFVVVLFLFSEHEVHRNNAFVRRYPHHPITKKYDLSLKYNSYYLAGYENEKLYLGNTTAPLHLLEINLKTKDTQHIRIQLDKTDLPFRAAVVKIHPPYFFVMDGTVPCIFRGKIGSWKANLWMKDKAHFSNALPIDSNTIFIRTTSSKTMQTVLGLIEKKGEFILNLDSNLLEPQIDGVFSVDGMPIISESKNYLGYVYFYRNQYLIMNSNLELLSRKETIDTVRIAQIKLSDVNKQGEVKMKTPPLLVNKTAALYKHWMLINSSRLGKNEDKKMLSQASIIDVYNWKEQTYEFSFYLYGIGKHKAREFNIYEEYLVALIENELSVYHLEPSRFD